jgi:hypothetical protein
MVTYTSSFVAGVASPFEDALRLIIALRGIDKPPTDIALGSLQRKLEEGLRAFDDLCEKDRVSKRPKF